jgi:hypothetical protein
MQLPFLLASSSNLETFFSGFRHLAGAFVVLGTLSALWGICALTAWLIKTLVPTPVAAAVAPAPPVDMEPPPAAAERAASGVSPEIVAVVAAAVHSAVGKGARVVSIKTQDSNWEKAGRQAVLGSHRLR